MDLVRQSGILLHITSLPGPWGIGDLGPEAYRFADFLEAGGQRLWQVLPVVPVGHGNSPYSSPSTFAGNPLFISPDKLIEDGLLSETERADLPSFPEDRVDFERVIPYKLALLERAFEAYERGKGSVSRSDVEAFGHKHASWLDDYALFETLKSVYGGVEWTAWPNDVAQRSPETIARLAEEQARIIRMHRFWQYLFDRQWSMLKSYCNDRGVRIFGDLPIYVAQDSADVWSAPELFHLDDGGQATAVAGVPPDYFSETGQRWGNPIYRWDRMRQNGYRWWTGRMARILEMVDIVRLDHFRGFEAFWEVPASEPTAVKGTWVKGPGAELFEAMERQLGPLPVVAENLGVITDGVTDLMKRFRFPGMAILQFAFDSGPENDFLPHNYSADLVAYTGTHDNDTFVGWWTDTKSTQEADVIAAAHTYCRDYLDVTPETEAQIHLAAIRSLMGSVASLIVIPLQDVLGYGGEARMNIPGVESGNWGWRVQPGAVTPGHASALKRLAGTFGRL